MRITAALAAALAVAALAAAGHADAADSASVIRIVSSLPRTGSANAQTTTMVNGIRLAISEAGGAVDGYTIDYVDMDDATAQAGQWDSAAEDANARKAVADPDVMAYIGTYNSGAAKVSMPTLNKAGLAMVSPANTWPGLTKPGVGDKGEPDKYRPSGKVTYFRLVPADDIQGQVAVQWAAELGAKKVFVLHDKELYGKGIAEMFRKNAKAAGVEIVGFEGIDPKAPNYRALATRVGDTGAQLVFFGGTTQTNGGQLAKDLVAGGLDVKFMAPDACFEKAFITAAGAENVNGRAYITFGGMPPDQQQGKGKTFVDNYRKAYGADPEGYAIYAYESAKVVLDAIHRAGKKDRTAILDAISATKDYDGALGKWSFDANGDTTLTVMSGNTIENGDFKFAKLLGKP
jgi:branched-chain amino acid transport system substrate-binding protein